VCRVVSQPVRRYCGGEVSPSNVAAKQLAARCTWNQRRFRRFKILRGLYWETATANYGVILLNVGVILNFTGALT